MDQINNAPHAIHEEAGNGEADCRNYSEETCKLYLVFEVRDAREAGLAGHGLPEKQPTDRGERKGGWEEDQNRSSAKMD